MLSLLIFLGYLIDSGIDLVIPIDFQFSKAYKITFDFRFNYGTIFSFIAVSGLVYILTSIQAVGSGLNESGSLTIKKYISFFAQFTILLIPILYIFALSVNLSPYAIVISLVLLIIHFLNFMENEKGEQI